MGACPPSPASRARKARAVPGRVLGDGAQRSHGGLATTRVGLRTGAAALCLAATCLAAALLVAGCARKAAAASAPRPESSLAELADAIGAGGYGPIDSLLVWRRNRLELEHYYRGYDAATLHECYSVTKSVTMLLALAAMQEGKLGGPDQSLAALLPSCRDLLVGPKAGLRLGDLLTMSSGLAWDELRYNYDDPRNPVFDLRLQVDPVRYILARPLAETPGTSFAYNSGLSIVLGAVVSKAVGSDIKTYAERRLFGPLGIASYRWDGIGAGPNCGWGLWLRPRDMLFLGRLMLGKGSFEGRRLLDAGLLEEAMRTKLRLDERRGYAWQLWTLRYAKTPPAAAPAATPGSAPGLDFPLALGYGGQFIIVFPELDAVVVSTASDYVSEKEGLMRCLSRLIAILEAS